MSLSLLTVLWKLARSKFFFHLTAAINLFKFLSADLFPNGGHAIFSLQSRTNSLYLPGYGNFKRDEKTGKIYVEYSNDGNIPTERKRP